LIEDEKERIRLCGEVCGVRYIYIYIYIYRVLTVSILLISCASGWNLDFEKKFPEKFQNEEREKEKSLGKRKKVFP
jgi:hypothetical protein